MTKTPEQHPLTTKLSELSPQVLAQIEKPLGTSGAPFPMWGSQRIDAGGGRVDLQQRLSVIADDTNPLRVYSERPYNEVVALAYCDMPVPSMLPLFFDGLERRRPESTNRTQMMIGDPGFGKSFLGALQGRMRTKERVEIYDCGGKNMNELLFEMVLDFGKGDALPTAIDKRLKAGTLEPLSLAKLKHLPGAAVTTDENGKVRSIDWNYFHGSANKEEVEEAHNILKAVSHIEGLDNAGGNALGMNSQYGPLIRWFIEGREGVLDEYNKSKEGTDNGLQTVLQFLNGEINTCTVENPLKNKDSASGPSSFTFKREDMKAGFFVTLTGNKTEDGLTTRSLNKSVYSRLSPQTLPDPNEADWQHRICQMMVGVPVSTLYTVFEEQAKANPAEFGEWLLKLRREKAKIEGVPVPELQEALLQNWESVRRATEKLAKFYNSWAEFTNADKIVANGHSDLVDEVDEEYSKKEGIDFRKVKQDLEEAMPIRPHMVAPDTTVTANFANFFQQPKIADKEPENPALFFGTRLVEYLERKVYEKTAAVGLDKLYEKLKAAMDEAGLRDITLQDGAHNERQRSVEEDLNVSAFDSSDVTKQAELARKVFCDFLREVDAAISEKDDDKIITIDKVRRALRAASAEDTAESHEVFYVNREYDTMLEQPLAKARIEDAATYTEEQIEQGLNFSLSDVVSHEDFMASLAVPVVSGKNMSAIWDTNIGKLYEAVLPDNPAAGEPDEALDIAENRSSTGIGTTTLRVLFHDAATNEDRDVSVHVVYNNHRNKALVVGEAVPSKLQAAFKEAGITHVDRNDRDARAKIDNAVSELTRGMPDSVKDHLVDAFKYRNDADLGSLLVARNVITAQQLETATSASAKAKADNPNAPNNEVGDFLVKQNAITADELKKFTSLSYMMVDPEINMMFGKYVVKNSGPRM